MFNANLFRNKTNVFREFGGYAASTIKGISLAVGASYGEETRWKIRHISFSKNNDVDIQRPKEHRGGLSSPETTCVYDSDTMEAEGIWHPLNILNLNPQNSMTNIAYQTECTNKDMRMIETHSGRDANIDALWKRGNVFYVEHSLQHFWKVEKTNIHYSCPRNSSPPTVAISSRKRPLCP